MHVVGFGLASGVKVESEFLILLPRNPLSHLPSLKLFENSSGENVLHISTVETEVNEISKFYIIL